MLEDATDLAGQSFKDSLGVFESPQLGGYEALGQQRFPDRWSKKPNRQAASPKPSTQTGARE